MSSKSVSVTTLQCLVCPPLLSMTVWMQHGMLDTRDRSTPGRFQLPKPA